MKSRWNHILWQRTFRHTGKCILCWFLCVLLLFASGCSTTRSDTASGSANASQSETLDRDSADAVKEQEAFDAWCDAQFVDTMEQADTMTLHYQLDNPETYGINEGEVTYGDLSEDEMDKEAQENEACYNELQGYNYALLTDEQQLTYDILEYYLTLAKESDQYRYYGNTLSPTLGVPANIPVTLAEYPLRRADNVDTYLQLLQKLPAYFEQFAQYEQNVAANGLFISDTELDESLAQMKEFIRNPDANYLITTFAERLESVDGLSKKAKKKYEKTNKKYVLEYVIPAYEQLIKDMENLRGSGTNEGGLCGFDKGKDYYSYLTKYYTCSQMSVDEVQDILEERIDRLMSRLRALVLTHPTLFDEYDAVRYSMTEPDEILEYLKDNMADYYPTAANVTYTVKHVDESLAESLSPAFYMIPQMDCYTDNVIYINDKSSNYDADDLYSTLAHEGFYGHLYQTTYFDSINTSAIRQILDFGGYSEGWATYVELSSYEVYDYGELDASLTDMMQIESEFSLALSSLADIGVNYEGWDRSDLSEFLAQYSMDDSETVEQIYMLVVEDPANYLQYYMSYLEFWNLRCKVKAQLGEAFDLKDYHTALLHLGPAPFPVLENRMQEYVASK